MKEENSDISRLIELKSYEQPEEGFFDQVLVDFQASRATYRPGVFESVKNWVMGRSSLQWSGMAVAACAALLFTIQMLPTNDAEAQQPAVAAIESHTPKNKVQVSEDSLLVTTFVENDIEFCFVDLSTNSESHEVEF